MGLLSKIFGGSKSNKTPNLGTTSRNAPDTSDKMVFSSPSILATSIITNVVNASSVEDDFDMAPNEEARKDLNISYEQVERLAREEGLLRAVGAAYVVKQYFDDAFYLKFYSNLYKPVAVHMYSTPTSEQIEDTRNAIGDYIHAIENPENEDMKEFQKQYLQRIYDDNENYYKLFLGGIGGLAIRTTLNTFEVVRDAYFKATQGVSYESYKLIAQGMDKTKNDSNA